ncbi:PAS domain-containing sensor histidine kinase [Pedobacter terrae]|uniref:PAS domain-containing sensor histidine kinase n=1 Tax=Pedobacter terrae TaxID=405671 RepID=UPI002FFBF64D
MSAELPHADQTFNISDEHLDIALAQVSMGFWRVNLADSNFMACSQQCKKNFGWDPSTAFSYADMLSCILPEDLSEMQSRVSYAIKEQQLYRSEYRVKHPDGVIYWIEANGRVLYENGIPYEMLGTTLDITGKKDLEILRDELLNVAMHELKTPLSTVRASLQLLERLLQSRNDERASSIVTRALGSTERINRLLGEMALPVNAKLKEINLAKSTFDIRRLADEMADNAMVIHINAQIKVDADADEVLVDADRYRIAQVITNLINNGIKYSENEPNLEITIATGLDQIRFMVRDYGIGIPAGDRKKVFQKFYRANTNLKVDGLGIGLYLCAEVIVRHGGSIWVEDLEQKGTSIIFTLPLSNPSEDFAAVS